MIYDSGLSHISAAAGSKRERAIMSASHALYLSRSLYCLTFFALLFPFLSLSLLFLLFTHLKYLSFLIAVSCSENGCLTISSLWFNLFVSLLFSFTSFFYLLVPPLRRWLCMRTESGLWACHVAIHPFSLWLSSLFHLPFAASSSIAHLSFFLHESFFSFQDENWIQSV